MQKLVSTFISVALASIGGWSCLCIAGVPMPMSIVDSEFSSVVESILPEHIGACVLVMDNGQVVFERAYGVTDVASQAPCTPETNFRLASVSKQFTAAALMLLVDRGRLSLDDTLDKFFPEFPEYGAKITVRHLLTHTSGVPDYEPLVPKGTTLQLRDLDVLDLIMDTTKPKFPAGNHFDYSNSGYALLGLIVEVAGKKPFDQFLTDEIFKPLGMDNTVMFVRGINEVSNRAFGHAKEDGKWMRADQSATSAVRGDGGVYSSLDDLAKWLRALDERKLLSTSAYDAIYEPATKTDRGDARYGFGWFIDEHRGELRISHEGDTRGFNTAVQRFPNRRAAVVVLVNSEVEGGLRELATQIAECVLLQQTRLPAIK